MNWYLEALKKYVVFSGHARRKEYWYFTLFNVVISIVLSIVDVGLGVAGEGGMGLLSGFYGLAMFLPGLAVAVRRLHDTDHSGWWLLIAFIPIIGAIILLVFMIRDSDAGENRFGPNPKGEYRMLE